MKAQEIQSLLAQHPFSKGFRPPQIARLAGQARTARFAPDTIIFHAGDACAEFYLIVSGRVALEMPAGKNLLRIQTLSDGDEFGFSALIMGRPMTFQARALQPVEALVFDGSRLLDDCREDPELGFGLMRQMLLIVSERLDATRLQLMDTYSPVAARAGA